MEIGTLGIVVAIVCGLASFLLSRWWTRRGQQKKADRTRAATESGQSRQVRRARERQQRR